MRKRMRYILLVLIILIIACGTTKVVANEPEKAGKVDLIKKIEDKKAADLDAKRKEDDAKRKEDEEAQNKQQKEAKEKSEKEAKERAEAEAKNKPKGKYNAGLTFSGSFLTDLQPSILSNIFFDWIFLDDKTINISLGISLGYAGYKTLSYDKDYNTVNDIPIYFRMYFTVKNFFNNNWLDLYFGANIGFFVRTLVKTSSNNKLKIVFSTSYFIGFIFKPDFFPTWIKILAGLGLELNLAMNETSYGTGYGGLGLELVFLGVIFEF